MKRKSVLKTIGCIAATLFAVNSFAGINDGLMAYYPFDGNANDMSGNGNHGTAYGGVTFVNGVDAAAANFNGVDGYIEVPSSNSLKPENKLSISLWVNIEQLPAAWAPIFHKGGTLQSNYTNRVYALWLKNTAPHFNLYSAGDGLIQLNHYAGDIDIAEWIHYAVVIDRENHNASVYLNGILVYRGADAYSSFNDNNSALRFGWTEERGSSYAHFKGKIDEVRMYNRALIKDEIAALYSRRIGSSDGGIVRTLVAEAVEDNWVQMGSTANTVQNYNGPVVTTEYTDFRGWLGSRKTWISFDISALHLNEGSEIENVSVILAMADKGAQWSNAIRSLDVFGLTNENLDFWDEEALTWNNAPGNNLSSRSVAPDQTIALGKLTFLDNSASVGNQFAISNKLLTNFIKNDSNGRITIILAQTVPMGGFWAWFESSETGIYGYSTPRLIINSITESLPCLSLSSSRIIPVEQNSIITKDLLLSNTSTSVQICTLQVLNPYDDINAAITGSKFLTLNPGESYNIPVEINTFYPTPGVYDIMVRVHSDICEPVYSDIFLKVLPPNQPPLPDLSITTSDINLTDYTINGPATLDISVHNNGTAEATNVPIAIYRFNNIVSTTTIASIAPGATQTIQVTIPVLTIGEHLINVFVDSLQTIVELDNNNNEANKIIKIGGQSVQPGGILVTATLPKTVYTNALFTISGRAMYDIVVDGARYLDFPVKGGALTLTVSDNAAHSWTYKGGHSTTSGSFSKVVQAPNVAGNYTVTIAATDQTFQGSRTVSFKVEERPSQPPQPPLPPRTSGSGEWIWYPGGGGDWNGYWEWTWTVPPSVPIQQQDISVYSENIHFSKNNPAQSEEMTIFTEINYWASSSTLDALNVPVNIYITRPGSEKVKIGSAVIDKMSVSAPENGSRFVYVNWKNEQDGVYIVEAEVDQSYVESNMKNNAATRAIIVGEYTPNQGILSGQVTGPEGGMKSVGIELYADYGMLRYTTTTDNGFYLIETLQVGTYTVKCVVPNGYASDTVSRTVEIVDQQVTTANFTLYVPEVPPVPVKDPLDALSGECEVMVADTPRALDQWGDTLKGTTDDPLSYTEQGEYTINWHFTDAHGNTTTQTQSIIVKDITPPVTEPLSELTGECSVVISTPPTAHDNCAGSITGTTTSAIPLVFDQQGTFSVIWTFIDGHGNSAMQTQTVVVADHSAPVPDVATLPVITGQCGVDVTVVPVATDNCASELTAVTTDPLSYSTQGTFAITWTFNDGHGNSATQVQTVIVNDDIAPVPNLLTLPAITGTGNVTVASIPTATDNCIGSVSGATTDPLTYNQPGTYTITWNYSDGHGNNSSQQQQVVVAENERCVSNLAARAKLDKIQLTWTHNGSTTYHIYRSEAGETSGFSEIATTSSTYSTFLDEGLTVGKTYWYKVSDDGTCSNSEVVSAVPQSRPVRTR